MGNRSKFHRFGAFFAHFLPPSILRLFLKTLRLFRKTLRLYQNSNKFDYRIKRQYFCISFYQYKNRMNLPFYTSVCTTFQTLFRNSDKLWFIRYDCELNNGDKLCNKLFYCIIIFMHYDYTLNLRIITSIFSIIILKLSIIILKLSTIILKLSIIILKMSIIILKLSIRTLMQSCVNLNFRRIILIQSAQDLINYFSNQSLKTIKTYNNKTV